MINVITGSLSIKPGATRCPAESFKSGYYSPTGIPTFEVTI